jgi:toxin ParE1/3/4
MNVCWTDTAIQNLSAIDAYLSQTSPAYAQRTLDRLTRRSQQFSQFPKLGRVVPEFGNDRVREVIEDTYRIIYYLKSDTQIDVLAVVHGAQQLDTEWLP